MDKRGLTATNFLKSIETRDKYECGICYQVCTKPVRCKGPCSKIFCMKCVSDARQQIDRCPYKCSQPFLVQRISDIQLDFFCPYNPTECHTQIDSLRTFDEHYRFCPYVSQDELYWKQMQLEYKCLKGHQLEFFVGSYEEMLESHCTACKQKRLCRSFCRICDQFYCVGCRVPPCSKEGCPIGHIFAFQRIASLNFICDICGVSTAVSNDGVYDDNLCNFGICQDCFSELPDKFDQSKPRELIANINTLCSCGKPLQYVNSFHHASICTICTKLKQCPKYCSNCEKKYCLSCKLMDINFDGTCGFDHEVEECEVKGTKSFINKEEKFGCMKCGRSSESYFYDETCKTRLCGDCIDYCRKVTSDKQRPVVLKCLKNHMLIYIPGSEDCYDECVVCKQQKIIKLRCMYCDLDGISFCFQCRPIPLETCYYKHPLRLATFQNERQCHFCRKETNEFHYCKKCYFYVCKQCFALHPPKNMDVQEDEPEKMEKKDSGSTVQKMEDCKPEEFDPDKLEQEQ